MLAPISFTALFGPAELAIAQIGCDGQLQQVNPALCHLLGYPEAALTQMTLQTLAGELDLPDWVNGAPASLCREVQCQTAFDARLWIELSASPLYEPDATLNGWLLFFIDISARKSLEQKIVSSEAWMRACFGAIGDLVLVLDQDCRSITIPPTQPALTMTGADNLMTMTTQALFGGDEAARWQAQVRQAVTTQTPQTLDYSLTVQGRPRWFTANITPINAQEAVWVARDITAMHQAMAQVRQTEIRLQGMLDSALDAIMVLAAVRNAAGAIEDFCWQVVNPAAAQLLGRSAADLLGRRLLVEMPGNRESGLFEHYVRVVETGEPYRDEFYYPHDRIDRWFQVVAVRLQDGFMATFRDITGYRRTADALSYQLDRALLVRQLTERLRSSLNPETLYTTAAEQVGQAFQADRCVIHRYDASQGDLPLVGQHCQPGIASLSMTAIPLRGNPHAQAVLAQERAIATADVTQEPLLIPQLDLCEQIGLQSILAVRTSYHDQPNGVIALHQCDRPRAWSRDEIELLESLAASLGIAIAQSSLLQQEQQQRQTLQHEIQQRQQVEADLRRSEAQNRAIIRAIPDLLLRVDRSERYLERIRSVSVTDLLAGDCTGQFMGDLLPAAVYERQARALAQALATGEVQVYEQQLLVEGEVSHEEVRVAPINTEEVLFIIRDISQRKRAEMERDRFFTLSLDLLCVADFDGYFRRLNPAWGRVLGYSEAEFQAAPFLSWVHPEDQTSTLAAIATLSQGQTFLQFENRYRAKDGSYRWLSWAAVPFVKERLIYAVARDVSEQKQTEAALLAAKNAAEVANTAKSQFLATMSHELRTPLNAILGFSQLLGHDPRLEGKQRDYVSIIERSGEHLLELINDVLSMSKIEAGQVSLDRAPFDLEQLLTTLYDMFQLKARSKGLTLTFEQEPQLPARVSGDASKLRQVLINLLGNAVKFTQQGSVTLRVTVAEAGLFMFQVCDTGPGIAAADLPRIFEPFTQSETGRKSQQGTGLGLPISLRFVQLMGGTLTVRSQGTRLQSQPEGPLTSQPDPDPLQVGACFMALLPLEPAPASPAIAPPQARGIIGLAADQPSCRILIVEDAADNRRLLRDILQPLGFVLREATDGEAALNLWRTWQPEAILMDIQMPGLDGCAATRQIRRLATDHQPVILAITAAALEDRHEAILAAGCNDIIYKPFLREVLLEKLAQSLGLRYRYRQDSPPPPSAPAAEPQASTIATLTTALTSMPRDWLQCLREAAIAADEELLFQLIGQLPTESVLLASTLTDLVLNFEVEPILQAVTQILQEE